MRLRVHNGDNPPLTPGKVRFSNWRRVVKFRSETPGDWFLYYGNADAKTVSYDLSWSANLEGAPRRNSARSSGIRLIVSLSRPRSPGANGTFRCSTWF